MLTKAGLTRLLVFGPARQDLTAEVRRLGRLRRLAPVELHDTPEALLAASAGQEALLVLDGSCLQDERLLHDLVGSPREAVAAWPFATLAPALQERLAPFGINAQSYAPARIARLAGGRLDLEAARTLLSGDDAFWLGLFKRDPALLFDVAEQNTYSYELRRHEPYFFLPVQTEGDNPAAKRALLDAAQKSVLDWPAWYLHRPIEKAIIYRLCEFPITPNQLTVLNNLVAFWGVYLFAVGDLFWAMIAALAVGVLDGLDGKQARVKVMTSKIGQIEEVLDKIYENGWYLAIAYWLNGQGFGLAPYFLFGILFACNMADILIGLVFKARRGVQLDDYGPFERSFRVFSGRRNTYIWTLVPFALVSLVSGQSLSFYWGFIVITVYAVLTVAVRRQRLITHLKESADAP